MPNWSTMPSDMTDAALLEFFFFFFFFIISMHMELMIMIAC